MTNRRELLKKTALATLGVMSAGIVLSHPSNTVKHYLQANNYKPEKPLTIICIGAGNRGNFYCDYQTKHPDELKVVGVAEPIEIRKQRFSDKYKIEKKYQFNTWEEVFIMPKFADAVLITTPDQLHVQPALKAMEMGYDILLEKPMAVTENDCHLLLKKQKETQKMVAVCHVLRYTPYFRKMKEILKSGSIGEIVAVQHLEPIGYWHMAHSYVRGNWRSEKTASPIVLAKSSHDLDILLWLTENKCKSIQSFATLKQFRKDKSPVPNVMRCTDNCTIEKQCPYSAKKLYLDMNRTGWPISVITDDLSYEGRLKAITEGQYGRCVYQCDNDVVDHQIVNMMLDKEVTVSFTMSAFTNAQDLGKRMTRIMGTTGELIGNFSTIEVHNFIDNSKQIIDPAIAGADANAGHGGGDYELVREFIHAVSEKNPTLLSSSIQDSLDSHILAFRAEESRKNNTVINL